MKISYNRSVNILISITSTLFLCACSGNDSQKTQSREDIIADSLQSIADSIALTRQMHSMQIGYHQHSTAAMASVQHNPAQGKKKIRFKKRQVSPQDTLTTSSSPKE